MRRLVANLALSVGLAVCSVALTGWWMSRTVLDPDRTTRIAASVLESDAVRTELGERIAAAVVVAVPQAGAVGAPILQDAISATLGDPAAAGLASGFLGDLHRSLLDDGPRRVVVPSDFLVAVLVRSVPGLDAGLATQAVAQAPAVTIAVPLAPVLAWLSDGIAGMVTGLAMVGIALAGVGLLVHPIPAVALRRIGMWMLGVSIVQLLVLWVLPVVVFPSLVAGPWSELVAGLARANAAGLITLLVALAVVGAVLVVGATVWRRGGGRWPRSQPQASTVAGPMAVRRPPVATTRPASPPTVGRPGEWRL